jgi:hypothetical protein
MNYTESVGLGWRVVTNFGTEVIAHTGSINGWNANVAFIPAKQIGVVALCSCDSTLQRCISCQPHMYNP